MPYVMAKRYFINTTWTHKVCYGRSIGGRWSEEGLREREFTRIINGNPGIYKGGVPTRRFGGSPVSITKVIPSWDASPVEL